MRRTGSLDDLARSLAEPMPRRRALALIGGSILGLSLGVRPPAASATHCLYVVCPSRSNPNAHGCCGEGRTCCYGPSGSATDCCLPESICNTATGRCEDPPCLPGTTPCGTAGACCAAGETCCGQVCCQKGEECVKGVCRRKCPGKRARCGNRCCPEGQYCNRGRCQRCPQGRKACGKKCCGEDQKCCDASRGLCCPSDGTCCPPQNAAQRTICCPEGRPCLYQGTALICCPPSRSAPKTFEGANRCCPVGQEAVSDPRASGMTKCCPTGERAFRSGGGVVCCASDRFAAQTFEGAGVCCPPGTAAVADPRGPGLERCA